MRTRERTSRQARAIPRKGAPARTRSGLLFAAYGPPTALMSREFSRLNSNLIGDLLAEARRNVRLTQSEVGRRVGRPQNWVSDIEHGHAYCRFDDFVAIAIALGADPAALCRRYLELRALREGIARQPVFAGPDDLQT